MEQTETKKLSDYILEGIRQTKPLRYEFMAWDDGEPYRACPIGAACFAKDFGESRQMLDPDYASMVARDLFPELDDTVQWPGPDSPAYAGTEVSLINLITSLNDHFKWRRDRIARYVRKLGY
jgi:hypothetical protein